MAAIKFYGRSDLSFYIDLEKIEHPSGNVVPLEDGIITGFFSLTDGSDGNDAVPCFDPDVPITVEFTEVEDSGRWLVSSEASNILPEIFTPKMPANGKCFIILNRADDIRTAVEMKWIPSLKAEIVEEA